MELSKTKALIQTVNNIHGEWTQTPEEIDLLFDKRRTERRRNETLVELDKLVQKLSAEGRRYTFRINYYKESLQEKGVWGYQDSGKTVVRADAAIVGGGGVFHSNERWWANPTLRFVLLDQLPAAAQRLKDAIMKGEKDTELSYTIAHLLYTVMSPYYSKAGSEETKADLT